MRFVVWVVALILAVGAVPVSAELRVSYDAQAKPLKNGLRFGDPLGFSLYDNAACAGQPVHAEILGAGTPDVTIEDVEPLAIKKEQPKPKPIARLRATLGVEVVGTALFLRVVGDGIEPVDEACQVQVSAVVGAPGPQGPPGRSFTVFDATGKPVGPLAYECGGASATVWLDSLQAAATFNIGEGALYYCLDGTVYSVEKDCAGPYFVYHVQAERLVAPGPVDSPRRYFVGQAATPSLNLNYASFLEPGPTIGGCINESGFHTELIPATEVTRESLGFAFPPDVDRLPAPLYIAPSPP